MEDSDEMEEMEEMEPKNKAFGFFSFLSIFIACVVQHLEDHGKTNLEDGKELRV
jgi:hypothetical protein